MTTETHHGIEITVHDFANSEDRAHHQGRNGRWLFSYKINGVARTISSDNYEATLAHVQRTIDMRNRRIEA